MEEADDHEIAEVCHDVIKRFSGKCCIADFNAFSAGKLVVHMKFVVFGKQSMFSCAYETTSGGTCC